MELNQSKISFCIPLVSETVEDLKKEADTVVKQLPDFAEWRVDYLDPEQDFDQALEVIKNLKKKQVGIIFTIRSAAEGGAREISDDQRLSMIKKAIESGSCDYVDIEKISDPGFTSEVTQLTLANQVGLIRSYHNFQGVPALEKIKEILDRSVMLCDVAKAAYMCHSIPDFVRLEEAGAYYAEKHDKPLILIGMGEAGEIGRIMPELLSSCLSYAKGTHESAPGQLSLDQIRAARDILGMGRSGNDSADA